MRRRPARRGIPRNEVNRLIRNGFLPKETVSDSLFFSTGENVFYSIIFIKLKNNLV